MLDPSERRLLSEHLRPPPGFELSHAVGTTFTLDLISALSVPLAFGAAVVRESHDPIALLDGVRRFADRIDVFAQAGEIFLPPASDLVTLLESAIHPVTPLKRGLFHPKVWLLEFAADQDRKYRLICSSRNLTADRTWDVALRIDSAPDGFAADNVPLQEFIRALPGLAFPALSANRNAAIERLADSLESVRWELPSGTTEMLFHALGVGLSEDIGARIRDSIRTVIVSPFLSDDTLATLINPDTADVISRPESFDRLSPKVLGTLQHIHTLDAGTTIAEDEGPNQLVGLHAKFIAIDRPRQSRIFVGSANATGGGFGGNVEFMVELDSPRGTAAAIVSQDSAFMNILDEYRTDGGVEDDQSQRDDNALDRAMRVVASCHFVVDGRWEDDRFEVSISTPSEDIVPRDFDATIRLLTTPGRSLPIPERGHPASVGPVALEDLTPFLVIDVRDYRGKVSSGVVVAELRGDRQQERYDAVIARQLDSPEKFLQLLLLLLAQGNADQWLKLQSPGAVTDAKSVWAEFTPGVFERLAQALTDAPAALDDLAAIIRGLETRGMASDVIPEGFRALWTTISAARKVLPR